jgi:hypothetical protein
MTLCYQCSGKGLTQFGTTMYPPNGAIITQGSVPQVSCTACGGTGIERSFGV